MVLPLLKVGRLALKTIGRPFSTGINNLPPNNRLTNTRQRRHRGIYKRPTTTPTTGTLNEDNERAQLIYYSVGAAALIYEVISEVRAHLRLKALSAKWEELNRQKIEAMAEARRGGGLEPKISRD